MEVATPVVPDFGLLALGFGGWALGFGLWAVGFGLWALGSLGINI